MNRILLFLVKYWNLVILCVRAKNCFGSATDAEKQRSLINKERFWVRTRKRDLVRLSTRAVQGVEFVLTDDAPNWSPVHLAWFVSVGIQFWWTPRVFRATSKESVLPARWICTNWGSIPRSECARVPIQASLRERGGSVGWRHDSRQGDASINMRDVMPG